MFHSVFTQQMPPSMMLSGSSGGGRIQGLVDAFESRAHLFAQYAYQVVCEVSPLPFEVTVLLVVFTWITLRQLVLWFKFDLAPQTNGYVYWHLRDFIDIEFRNAYKPEHHLTSALIVYITQKLWREKPLTAAELKNKTFTIHLLSLHCKSVDDELAECYSDSELEFRDHEELMLPVKLPIYPSWTPVHEGGVEMCTWISTTRVKNCYPEAHRFLYLRVRKDDTNAGGANADAALRRFVDDAVAFYFEHGYGDRDNRALRMLRVSPGESRIRVTATPLPLAPTLDTVFFPQRAAVQQQLRRFAEMKGRYAIAGFPRKLGFLLYGPRGTGKRSFVRALAYHTKRHIVRVPLAAFTRNEELYQIFHFEEANYGSAEEWKMLNSKKVIFLLEDVDTESDVVRARGSGHTARVLRSRGLTTRSADDAAAPLTAVADVLASPLEHAVDGAKPVTNETEEEDDALTATTSRTTSLTPRAQDSAKVVAAKTKPPPPLQQRKQVPPVTMAPVQVGWGALFAQEDAMLDAIDLSALLNVLDGAVEEPERIVVMIAEHPERLDPALLRPGRLATHLRFDYMELDDLISLCGLFYGTDCASVQGTLRNGATTTSMTSPHMGGCAYASVSTNDDDTSPRFPHETASAERSTSEPENQALVRSDDALLNWQRHEYVSMETTVLDGKVIRQLSTAQAEQVRACISTLEEENASYDNGRDGEGYNFFVTPAHVHHLCMRSKTLDSFLIALSACIRCEAHVA